MKPKVVVPGDFPPQIQGSAHLERLRSVAEVIVYTSPPHNSDDKVQRALDAVCLINSRGLVKWSGAELRQLKKLKMVTVCGIGTDAIDLIAAEQLGITVCNLPGVTSPIVAEHTLALIFAVSRRAWASTQAVKEGKWAPATNLFLRGKTLGIVGCGSIGSEVARLGNALGMNVAAWTFHPSEARAKELKVSFLPLEDVLRTSDVVSLHLPLTPQSRGKIGAAEIALLKPQAILINTSRGGVLDHFALVEPLQSGRLAGVGLDVFEPEPPPIDHPLLKCDRVIFTPHNADQTLEGIDWLNAGCVDNIIAFLKGSPRHRVV